MRPPQLILGLLLIAFPQVALGLTPKFSPSGNPLTGTLEDAKHIVLFMQENRPFDHYLGTLRGGRGFADRSAPMLPSRKPVWYQQANVTALNPLCGCMKCNIHWAEEATTLRALLETQSCNELAEMGKFTTPQVSFKNGMRCSDLLAQVEKTTIFNERKYVKMTEFISAPSTCPAGLKVSGLDSTSKVADAVGESKGDGSSKDDGYIMPFHLPFDKSSATCMAAPTMNFPCDTEIFNGGNMNKWNSARNPDFGMSHFNRSDLPFYHALADAFTFGDHYYQSTFSATNPNRQLFFTGSNGLSADSEFCMMDDDEPGFDWETMGETLSTAGVSWKVYMEQDNFDDNAFAWFNNFKNAKPGDELYERGMRRGNDLVADFAADLGNDTLPQVSWIVGPSALSEHATNHPADGEDLSARILKALRDHPKMYEKTLFILNYDEGGQFFDHLWSPVPPKNDADGLSTITTLGELTKRQVDVVPPGNPIGLGFRVPMFVISPWSRGGYVFSEVTDHTSVIKLVERRFGVRCPNISPWRRAITGDVTAALDFERPDFSPWPILPDTSANVNTSKKECATLPAPTLPEKNQMPTQEPGTRPSRPLPYVLDVHTSLKDTPTGANLTLAFVNAGQTTGAVFIMYDRVDPENTVPRKYTVEAGKNLLDTVMLPAGSRYGYSVHGPNGFVRQVGGHIPFYPHPERHRCHEGTVQMRQDAADASVVLLLNTAESCQPGSHLHFTITDNAYGAPVAMKKVAAGSLEPTAHPVSVVSSGNWYDLSVEVRPGRQVFRFMGRLETGLPSISDPASASGTPPTELPAAGFPVGMEGFGSAYQDDFESKVPHWYRTGVAKWDPTTQCITERQRIKNKDACWEFGAHHDKDEL